MAKQSQIAAAIEKAESEIAFQQRLIDALKATQKAQSATKRATRKPTRAADVGAVEGRNQ